jgi:hypothetical protein
MMAILTVVRWNLNMVLICISVMARDSEHFFMCFFSYLDFVLRKSSVHCSYPFLYWVIDFFGSLVFELPVYSGYQYLV